MVIASSIRKSQRNTTHGIMGSSQRPPERQRRGSQRLRSLIIILRIKNLSVNVVLTGGGSAKRRLQINQERTMIR